MSEILRAQSHSPDAQTAVTELKEQFRDSSPASLILFFCSCTYDLQQLAENFNIQFPDIEVVGCTSAGEIGPEGYLEHSLTAILFPKDEFDVVTGSLYQLYDFSETKGIQFVQNLVPQLTALAHDSNNRYSFAMQLIDGLSKKEELISHCFQKTLGRIPLFGGSAADNLQFTHTYTFHRGKFSENSCVLILFNTNRPFRLFKTQHFSGTRAPLVITAADVVNRTIIELNGLPAALVYAQEIGCSVEQLNARIFAASPVVIKMNGNEYVRSIQKMYPDGSLQLYCAIDEGVVLRVANSINLTTDLDQQFEKLQTALGDISLTLVCDCILRRTDIVNRHQLPVVSDIFMRNQASGFSSFGEQFGGLHLNQTCTGIAFGRGDTNS